MKPPKDSVLRLIERVVTGDGAQLENLTLTDDEWRTVALQMMGPDYEEHFEVTMRFEDWLTLIRLTRLARIAASHGSDSAELAVPVWADVVADMSSAASSLRRVVLSGRFDLTRSRVLTGFADLIQGWVDRVGAVREPVE